MVADLFKDWRVRLIESYPDLFHPSGNPPSAQGWPCVGDGWRDLLERACVRIRAAIQADSGSFRATQIKEKYGRRPRLPSPRGIRSFARWSWCPLTRKSAHWSSYRRRPSVRRR